MDGSLPGRAAGYFSSSIFLHLILANSKAQTSDVQTSGPNWTWTVQPMMDILNRIVTRPIQFFTLKAILQNCYTDECLGCQHALSCG